MENRYEQYKDSGIAWIGEIPEHWEIGYVGKYFNEVNNRNTLQKETNTLQFKMGEIVCKSDGNSKYNPESIESYNIVCPNTIMINGLNLSFDFISQRVALVKERGAITSAYLAMKPKDGCSPLFLTYLFKSYDYKKVFHSLGKGLRATLNYNIIRNELIIIPPFLEQQSIATYLDQKCSEIDELITLQEEMITKLQSYKQSVITEAVTKGLDKNVPLKDSGIEWIGEIPEHWEVKRLKFSCNVFGRIGFRGYKSDDLVSEGNGAITLSPSNMKDMKMDYTNRTYLSWKKYYESPEIMISKNDILMVKTGSTYGKCSFVDDIPMECTINPQIVVFKQHKDYPKFLAYSFQTKATRAFVETSVVGGTIPTIAQEKIMNYFFAFPPLPEQQSIATYLDQKCSEIDALISIKQQKIEKLKDYKKSLIFECVTGKRKVS